MTVYEYMTAPSGTVHVRRQEAPWMGTICGTRTNDRWILGDESLSARAADCGRCLRIAGVRPHRGTSPKAAASRAQTDHHADARSVVAAGFCGWDTDLADFEGDDLARVALEALTAAGFAVVKAVAQ